MLHKFLKGTTALCIAGSLVCVPVLAVEAALESDLDAVVDATLEVAEEPVLDVSVEATEEVVEEVIVEAPVTVSVEGTLSTNYIEIEGEDFVATTLDGVPALYNSSTSLYYYCSELIPRYYAAVYNLNIGIGSGQVYVYGNSDVYFTETDTPQKGDILYASPEARGKDYSHWAIVKDFDGETITVFEQNWCWNGMAGIDRVISYPETCYTVYTMNSYSGVLPERLVDDDIDTEWVLDTSTASSWAVESVERAAEAEYAQFDVVFTDDIQRELFCQLAVSIAAENGVEAEGETAKAQAASLGLISNTETDTLTRQEAAVITVRLMELIGTLPEADLNILGQYSDQAEIGDWSADAVAQLTACGLFCGSDGKFQPQSTLTVEQAIVLLVRVADNAEATMNNMTHMAPPVQMASMEVAKICSKSMFLSR